jgi:hypothetical protein
MTTDAEKLRVLIATTNGPVEVLLLTEEEAAVGRSVACIGGTTETADIAAAYHAFVVRPTGVVESQFGHPCYRIDLSGRIDAGSSWQLGVFAAHALHAAGRLAEEKDAAAGVLWATGSVRPVDLSVGAVSHVLEKLTSSLVRLKQEAAAGRRVLMAIPEPNASELPAAIAADLAASRIEVLALTQVEALWDKLELKLRQAPRRNAANPLALRGGPVRPRTVRGWTAVAAALLCIASGAAYLLGRAPTTVVNPGPASAPPAQSEAEILVPETMPYVSDRDRATVRTVYLAAPDHKALAASFTAIGMSTGQSNDDTAGEAAVTACIRASQAQGIRSPCELYAVGDRVVTERARPPMPPQPWVIRDPLIETPFSPAEVPMRRVAESTERYANAPSPKALALSPTGAAVFFPRATDSIDEAVRRSLERCGGANGVACMIIAVDNSFVIPIPRLTKVVGLFRPGAAPDLRGEVARRLAGGARGWSAVAIGAGGRAGITLGVESEQAAIDGAMADCGQQDRECRVTAIGPFLVERLPQDDAVPNSPPR